MQSNNYSYVKQMQGHVIGSSIPAPIQKYNELSEDGVNKRMHVPCTSFISSLAARSVDEVGFSGILDINHLEGAL